MYIYILREREGERQRIELNLQCSYTVYVENCYQKDKVHESSFFGL